MTEETPPAAAQAFEDHEAFERAEDGFRVTTTAFDATVTASDADGPRLRYTVTVSTPMLRAATGDDVGDAVEDGWFDTFERRLADAPQATRATVDLDEVTLSEEGDRAVARLAFTLGSPDQAADVAKTFVEYVEGTYVEGVVPGYDYEPPVADLLAEASQGDGERGGTPL
jgi:hypothetical protein